MDHMPLRTVINWSWKLPCGSGEIPRQIDPLRDPGENSSSMTLTLQVERSEILHPKPEFEAKCDTRLDI